MEQEKTENKTAKPKKARKSSWPSTLKKVPTHYCAGCGHGVIHRLVAEVLEEMGFKERAIGVPPAGCAVLAYFYFDVDMTEAAHGRGCATATGIKRALPEAIVFTYQGDGDLAAIGTAELIHAANRGERITVIFVNNAVYGMTGGQMAPTTIIGQRTTTSPMGRRSRQEGYPIKVCELLSVLEGTAYIERTKISSPKDINKTKRAIRRAFEIQDQDIGFSLIEILSACPTNWKKSPVASIKWIDEVMTQHFPIGVFKDVTKNKKVESGNAE